MKIRNTKKARRQLRKESSVRSRELTKPLANGKTVHTCTCVKPRAGKHLKKYAHHVDRRTARELLIDALSEGSFGGVTLVMFHNDPTPVLPEAGKPVSVRIHKACDGLIHNAHCCLSRPRRRKPKAKK